MMLDHLSSSDHSRSGDIRASPQARFRDRQKAKQFALQVQLVDLQERLKELELERTQHRAQLDALSQCMRNVSHVQPRIPFADRLAEGAERLDDRGAAAVAALVSFMRGVGAPGTTAAECRVVSADFMVDVFAGNVQRCSALIEFGAENESSVAAGQLKTQIELFVKVLVHLGQHSRSLFQKLSLGLLRRAGAAGAGQPKRYPERVLAHMQLTDFQQEAVVVAYHAMMARLQITFAKQQALLSSMAAPAPPGSDGQRDHMVMLRVNAVAAQVQEILREYAVTSFAYLRPIQVARGIIADAPHVLDMVQLGAHMVAHRCGERLGTGSGSG